LIDYGKYIFYFIDRLIDVLQLPMDSKIDGNLFMHINEPFLIAGVSLSQVGKVQK